MDKVKIGFLTTGDWVGITDAIAGSGVAVAIALFLSSAFQMIVYRWFAVYATGVDWNKRI